MDVTFKKVLVICFLAVLASAVAKDGTCPNGADCIALAECEELYQRLRYPNNVIKNLLKALHCGFENPKTPKICCPPNLKDAVSPLNNNSYDPIDLLPDFKVCGLQNHDRIVGGTLTELDEYPWMALLKYEKRRGSGFHCGGVLISSRYVLTAAHCVSEDELPKNWTLTHVRLGEWNMTSEVDCILDDCSPPPLNIAIEEIIPHADYSPPNTKEQNDIALLRLAEEVKFNDFVKPICLPLAPELWTESFVGYSMVVAGWGKTETKSSSNVKLKVDVPVVNMTECQNVYNRRKMTITEKQICAGGSRGQDSCRGDSGGPLMGQVPSMTNWMALGVVSYGPTPCGTAGWPGVYTRVTAFIDWILDNIRP